MQKSQGIGDIFFLQSLYNVGQFRYSYKLSRKFVLMTVFEHMGVNFKHFLLERYVCWKPIFVAFSLICNVTYRKNKLGTVLYAEKWPCYIEGSSWPPPGCKYVILPLGLALIETTSKGFQQLRRYILRVFVGIFGFFNHFDF